MVRKVTPAQFKNMVRQAEAKQRQAVNQYNNAVRKHNAEAKRAVDEYNREVHRTRQAVNEYNRKARAHNTAVRSNRQRLQREINRLNGESASTRYVTTRASSVALHATYKRVEADFDAGVIDPRGETLVDLVEAEVANSAHAVNALHGPPEDATVPFADTSLGDELSSLSADLDSRWRGALFSLNPSNPDAARHFCTSSREVIVKMIDLKAPDAAVLEGVSNVQTTDSGQPTRRAKINYLLTRYGTEQQTLGDFVESDVDDVLKLFRTFNDGTHGDAGTFGFSALQALKDRVEGAIRLLSTIIKAV